MKEKLLKNWGLKIMAVLISFLVWFLVANIEDYSVTKTITGIPVSIMKRQLPIRIWSMRLYREKQWILK